MQARGEPLRADDSPDVLHQRLVAYREQTAPLIAYYRDKGMLRTVDGMAPIENVAAQIDKLLAAETDAPAARAQRPLRPHQARKAPAKSVPAKAGAATGGRTKPSPKRARKAAKPAARKAQARAAKKTKARAAGCAASRRPAAPRQGAKPARAKAPAARSEPVGSSGKPLWAVKR